VELTIISEPLLAESDYQRAFARRKHVVELGRAGHQAHQIDFEHPAKAVHFELAAPVDHGTLRQHQHVELFERRLELLDRPRIGNIELRIFEAMKIRSVAGEVIGGIGAGAADRDAGALAAKRLRDAVADPAGAADHQHLPAAEIKFVHRLRPC
jgi:hypothetical protein